MTDWSRLAKLAGMLGSPHDGERLNAARLLDAALTREGVTFGDLATRIADGVSQRTVYVDRETTIVERPTPNPAGTLAHKIIDKARDRLTFSERRFLNGIVRNADMTNGKFALTDKQANWLMILEQTYLAPVMRKFKSGKAKPIPQAMFDELGLGDSADFEGHVGAFRSTIAGERPRKVKPDPRPAGQAPPRTYNGDFDSDPLDSGINHMQESDDDDDLPF